MNGDIAFRRPYRFVCEARIATMSDAGAAPRTAGRNRGKAVP
jgi:hypothetical protein